MPNRLNMKHVTFSKGGLFREFLVTPTGWKPLSKDTAFKYSPLVSTSAVCGLVHKHTITDIKRKYKGWNKQITIV